MSVTTICQAALKEIGETEIPDSFIGSSNDTGRQAGQIAITALQELAEGHPWQAVLAEHSFSTAASDADYALPTDIHRGDIFADTVWNQTSNEELLGPLGRAEWARRRHGTIAPGTRQRWRVRGALFLIDPTPTAVETVSYEYRTNLWAADSGGTDKATFTVDSDTANLDEYLLQKSVEWRWLQAKGLPFEDKHNAFVDLVEGAFADDTGTERLMNVGGIRRVAWPYVNIPEGDWS